MKLLINIFLFFTCINLCKAQIVVNSESYKDGTLVVEADNRTAPTPTSGVIIPRVQKLNTTDSKQDGLLVYLNNPTPPLATGEYNGFYYWSAVQNKWIPLQSRYGSNTIDNSQFFVSGNSFATPGGYMDDSVNPAVISLNTLTTNNPSLCSLAGNVITVNKTGWYYFQISVTLTKNANPILLRDILCLQMYKNGAYAFPIPSVAIVRSFNAFAGANLSSNTFTTYSPLKLNAGDNINLSVELIYKDPASATGSPSGTPDRVNAIYTITQGTEATLSGKYLGNF